jgi:hypothetical protein
MQKWQKQVLKMTKNEPNNLIKNLEKMETTERDYTVLNEVMTSFGFVVLDKEGCYFHPAIGLEMLDLSASNQDLKTIILQIIMHSKNVGFQQGQEEVQQTIRTSLGL